MTEHTNDTNPPIEEQKQKKPYHPILRILALIGAVLLLLSSLYPYFRLYLQ